jgi:hypothetical protein
LAGEHPGTRTQDMIIRNSGEVGDGLTGLTAAVGEPSTQEVVERGQRPEMAGLVQGLLDLSIPALLQISLSPFPKCGGVGPRLPIVAKCPTASEDEERHRTDKSAEDGPPASPDREKDLLRSPRRSSGRQFVHGSFFGHALRVQIIGTIRAGPGPFGCDEPG